jgi:hypothetical protein
MASWVVTRRGGRARRPRHHAQSAANTVAPAGAASQSTHGAAVMSRNGNRARLFAVGATRAVAQFLRNIRRAPLVLLPWQA